MALPYESDMLAMGYTQPELNQLGFYGYSTGGPQMPFSFGSGFSNPNVQSAVSNVANRISNGIGNTPWYQKWFGNQGIVGGIGSGLAALGLVGSGIFSAIMANKNYDLAQKALNYQMGLGNRNLANQAKILNNTYDTAGNVGAGLIGAQDANGNYGGVDSKILASQQEQAKKNHVDGSPIRV